MSKKTNSSNILKSIFKLNWILKIHLNNDELPGLKKSRHYMRLAQYGVLEFTVRPGYSLCSSTGTVKELMFKKYFKVFLVYQS